MSRFRSLLQASIAATKRALAWNVEDLMPPSEKFVFNFNSKEELKRWHLHSDSEFGGLSTASLEITDVGSNEVLSGVFSGNLSLDITEGSLWKLKHSGFCGMRSKKFNGFIDLESYDTLAMRVRGDGRCYISTIYTDNWLSTTPGQQENNSWQALVYAPKNQWHVTKIPLHQYVAKYKGRVISSETEMNPSRVVAMALSVNAERDVRVPISGPGDFRLEIDWIKALRTTDLI
ncbi:probable complex I intermediate-associated protein 30 isoform X1 [Zingiber officinale]|uniref:probable complex I intermediate-associated protein 30 isoform X1 n=1 Tax=Zingiber officinale TaxID=94328 RepID=UPI001C4D455B|nr:probable complex I intermediate-associated protein 30 isoform X1 [Zingiber officinale]